MAGVGYLMTEAEWREIAFSYGQIQEYLSIVSLPYRQADEILPFDSPQFRCFCSGFYFFIHGIRGELNHELGEALRSLAVRVEASSKHPTTYGWNSNAEKAVAILERYFS